MTDHIWGASPADWAGLTELGLTQDLLPTICNPNIEISPNSKLPSFWKVPSLKNANGQAAGFVGWAKHYTAPAEIERWQRDGDLGICISTRQVRAFDIDVADPALAQEIQDVIEDALMMRLPVRWRANSGSRLLAVRVPGMLNKRIAKFEGGMVEFLANGQQFVAVGHHRSGVRYVWGPDGASGPDEIPEVSEELLDEVWSALVEEYAGGVDTRVGQGRATLTARRRADINDPLAEYLAERGWLRDDGEGVRADGALEIRCPFPHESGEGSPSSTVYFPAGVGGEQAGHFVCLHASCAERDDGDFKTAVEWVEDATDDFDVVLDDGKPAPRFERYGKGQNAGKIKPTTDNLWLAMTRQDWLGAELWHDDFLGQLFLELDGERLTGDDALLMMRVHLDRRGFVGASKGDVRDVMHRVAGVCARDSAIDWIESLKWDGVPRVGDFVERWLNGQGNSEYLRAISFYVWSAMAGRVLHPGVKADMVPVMVGPQGCGKSRTVEALAPLPDTFAPLSFSERDDNLARLMRGKLVGELAELRGLRSREAEAIKAWLTQTHERWIPKYMEGEKVFPRRLLFWGTSNDRDGFLDDPTGERRWLPFVVGEIDVDEVAAVVEQLWAEGAHLFRMHSVMQAEAERLARDEVHQFKAENPWVEVARGWCFGGGDFGERTEPMRDFKTAEAVVGATLIPYERVTRRELVRMASALRELGYEQRATRDGHRVVRLWVPAKDGRI